MTAWICTIGKDVIHVICMNIALDLEKTGEIHYAVLVTDTPLMELIILMI